MRVLLVTWTDHLLEKLSILNPELEYRAIVVDEVEPAKKILEQVGLPKDLLYPLYELKECVKDFHYDYVLCVEQSGGKRFLKILREYDVPQNKLVGLNFLDVINFFIERVLRYFKEHFTEFEMFATGISWTEMGLDGTRFKRRLFNLARSSQDLYYNFQTAKFALLCGGGYSRLKYVLIGLAPFSFNYDVSKASTLSFWMLHYLIAFGDLHNFHMTAEDYKSLLRPQYFSTRLPLEPLDWNNPFEAKTPLRFMTPESRLNAREGINTWSKKFYPETRAENVKILDDYLTLCEENNVRPIMFLPPATEGYKKYFNRKMLDEFYYLIGQACKKHPSAIFIDGWKLQGITDRDFYDIDHMNIQGAAKFSTFLNSVIEQLDGH